MEDRLHLQDCKCPICMCILIEPVRMPCNHELCMPCFKQNVEEAHFTCPICRLRISSWARKQSRLGQLMDKKRWKQIQEAFPILCQKRLNGDDEDSEYEEASPDRRKILVAEPGEIRKEYEAERNKFQKIRQQEEKQGIEESEELIKRLQREELLRYEESKAAIDAQQQTDEELAQHISADSEKEQWKREQEETARDEELARRLQREERSEAVVNLSGPSTSTEKGRTSSMKCARLEHLFSTMERRKMDSEESSEEKTSPTHAFGFFSPTTVTRLPSMEDVGVGTKRTKSAESEDSITTEVYHFKPIKTSPRTARRRLADGSRDSPPIIHSTPRNLSNMKSNKGKNDMTPAIKSRLVEMLYRNLPDSPTKSDTKLSKEVQASPTKYSKTSERELSDAVPVGNNSHDENVSPNEKENVNSRRVDDIKFKLSKYSRRAKEEPDERTDVVSRNDDRENNRSKSNTKRKKGGSRGCTESKTVCNILKRPQKSTAEEYPTPRKKCRADVRMNDKNANNILMNNSNHVVDEEDDDDDDDITVIGIYHNNGQGDSGILCTPANGIQSSNSQNSHGNRKSSGQTTIVKYMELLSEEQKKLQQEDRDHRIALNLQRQFEEAPLSPVVRTKGSEDAYPLRANRNRPFRTVSPNPDA